MDYALDLCNMKAETFDLEKILESAEISITVEMENRYGRYLDGLECVTINDEMEEYNA